MSGPEPAIAVRGLVCRYAGAPRPALDGIDLELPAGTVGVVMGATGAGKSTLARCLTRLVPCFLAGGDYRSFLERNGVPRTPGVIVDEAGAVLGRHDGIWRFTPGQRRGLGVAGKEPLYALRSDAATNTLVVAPRASLGVRHITAAGRLHVPVTRAVAKLRYRSTPVRARVEPIEDGFELELDEPVEAVAAGQVAVLYDGDAVVGAGVIGRVDA